MGKKQTASIAVMEKGITNAVHEITLGKCEGTSREIKKSHNLAKLLFAGEFDWYRKERI